ncbi:calcium-binding protein, partial [Phenylobacterium soli]
HVDTHGIGVSGAITVFNDEGAGNDTLDGGAGNDLIKGEAGDDKLISGSGNDTLDGGTGADTITAQAGVGEVDRVTLGGGVDKLVLDSAFGGSLTVTDFQAGASGDVLDLSGYLTAKLSGWNGSDNPFTGGFLRLLQDGASTLVQIDANGGGDSFATVATLQNTSSLLLTSANLGYTPAPMVIGGPNPNTFTYEPGSAVSTVLGGSASDVLNITAPAPAVGHSATIAPSPDGSALLFDLDGDGTTDLTVSNVEDIVLNGQRVVISGDLSGTGLAPHTIHYTGTSAGDVLDASGLTSLESVRAQGLGGNDTLTSAGSDDTVDGGDGDDLLSSLAGPDLLIGGAGNDTLSGGTGNDVAEFSGLHSDYTITDLGGGDLQVSGPDGTDKLSGIEQLQFDDGLFGQNHAPDGTDRTLSIYISSARTLSASDFGFTDPDGDSLGAVKIATLPGSGSLTNSGVAVTAGQVVTAADIAAGHLVYTPAALGQATFTFQVQDAGLVGWGTNLDATPNTLTLSVSNAPPPSPPPPPTVITSGTSGTGGNDTANLGDAGNHFAAGDGFDSVTSGSGDDYLQGNAGDDTIFGGAGNDVILGGRDNDRLSGDDGNDWVSGDLGDDTLAGGIGNDTLMGGAGNDSLDGGTGDSYLRGGEGDDQILGGSAFDNINGNQGADTVAAGGGNDWVSGGQNEDKIDGQDGDDLVFGNMGADTCDGGAGDDVVRGGQDNDLVRGGDGKDWLSGDRGDDTLVGGAGADTFFTFDGAGVDRVTDFNAAEGDRVQVDPGSHYTVSQVGSDTVIDLGGGTQMILVGVQSATLPAGWIVGA